jgi:hypothetical protein
LRQTQLWLRSHGISTIWTALPDQKVGEIRIVSLKTRRAFTKPFNGDGFEVGQIVRVKA